MSSFVKFFVVMIMASVFMVGCVELEECEGVSEDSGLTWTETSPLPGANSVKSLVFDDKKIIYAGANATGNQAEVYFSGDKGLSWDKSGEILGRSSILSLLGFESGFMVAGTNIDASVFRAGYFQYGHIISKPYFTGATNSSTKYGIIEWTDSLNGQIINVRVRSAEDSTMSSAPPWGTGVPSVTNGDSIVNAPFVNDGDPYIQYYVQLNTESSGITPVLKELSIEYSVDTIGPKPVSAIAYDGTIQQNGIDDDDYVVITFNEPTNAYHIPKDSIDYYLKLNQGSWSVVDTAYWSNAGNASNLIVELNATSTISVGVRISPDTVIKDMWNNNAYSSVTLTGTFDDTIPPIILSAFASDNIDSIQGIDGDDFLNLVFSQVTNKPIITAGNINSVLHLSGGHIWGSIDSTLWSGSGETLTIFLDTLGNPTVSVGDTIFPDSLTIEDESGNPCISPRVITGTFGDYGPVIKYAIAYDGIIPQNGIDKDDYVRLFFNEETNAPQIGAGNIDNVLQLSNGHTWNPIAYAQWNGLHSILEVRFDTTSIPTVLPGDTIYPDSSTITDLLGQPCVHPVVLTGSFSPGVEELGDSKTILPTRLNLTIQPNPARDKITIFYDVPAKNAFSNGKIRIELFDVTGRKVKTVVSKAILPGRYSIIWQDKHIKQGIYFVKISSCCDSLIRKIILLH